MADALIKFETIDDDQIQDIMAGKEPKPPAENGTKPTKRKPRAKKTTVKKKVVDTVDKSEAKVIPLDKTIDE